MFNKRTTRRFHKDNKSLLISTRKISKQVIEKCNSSIIEVFRNRALGGSPVETLRILSAYVPENEIERVAKSMLLLTAYRAEQKSPLSSYLLLKMLTGFKIEQHKSRKMKVGDLPLLLSKINSDTIESILLDTIRLAGSSGNVSVSIGGITHVSVENSVSFPVIVSPSFTNATSLTSRKLVVYDGVIESIGQVNRLLEECAANKASVLLLARSFMSDVISTIISNNQRGVFDIVAATSGVSFEDELTINDVRAVMNLSPDNLLSLDVDGNEENMIIEGGQLKISLKNVEGRDKLLNQLKDELRSFKEPQITAMISQRVSRLNSRRISVVIGEEFGSTREILKERFDCGMRMFVSARRHGICDIENDVYSFDSVEIAKSLSKNYESLIKKVGGVLVIDKNLAVAKRKSSSCRRSNETYNRQEC